MFTNSEEVEIEDYKEENKPKSLSSVLPTDDNCSDCGFQSEYEGYAVCTLHKFIFTRSPARLICEDFIRG